MRVGNRQNTCVKRVLLGLYCSTLIVFVLAGCDSGSTSNVKPTPTPISFIPLQLDLPAKALNAPITGNVPESQLLHVGVTLKINQQVLDQMSQNGIAKPGDTTSANDIAKKLGISDADYQRLKQFFGVNGATLQLSQTRTSMTLDIKAGVLAQLLQTKFVQHTLDNRTFYTPDPQHMPKIPAAFANFILAVTGLDNYSLPPTHHVQTQVQQNAVSKQANVNCDTGTTINGARLAHAYGYDQMWKRGWHGENMTIDLVEMDSVNLNDIHTYFTCAGFNGKIDFINVDGIAPKPRAGDGEATLDIEMLAGLAPAVHIKDYQTDLDPQATIVDFWGKYNDILQRILDDNAAHPDLASAVSISWGSAEEGITGETAKAVSQRLQLLTKAEHMSVYVASGDCGAYDDGTLGSLSVDYPASDPSVVSVGGTTLIPDQTSNRFKEIAWTRLPASPSCQNDWGSGGGVSTIFKRPAWQQASGVMNKYSNGFRQVPDIAAVGEVELSLFINGTWISGGGTSAATPIWTAGMALVNQGLLETKKLYVYGPDSFYFVQAHAGNLKPYYDETEGSNLYYFAGPGWDYTTGLGSPNLPAFYQVIYNNATI